MEKQYQSILEEYQGVEKKLSQTQNPEELKTLGKRQRELSSVVEKIHEFEKLEKEIAEHQDLAKDQGELADMARSELPNLETRKTALEEALRLLMLPRDPLDEKNAIMEIRAAAGGDESGLFGAELFHK